MDKFKARVGDKGGAGIRDQSQIFTLLKQGNKVGGFLAFYLVVVRFHGSFNLKVFQEKAGVAGVFGQNQVDRFKGRDSSGRHVLEVADGG